MEKKNAFLPKMKYSTRPLRNHMEFSDGLIVNKQSLTRMSSHIKRTQLPKKQQIFTEEINKDVTHQILKVRARNILRKNKQFDSPEMLFALSDVIRQEASMVLSDRRIINNNQQNLFSTKISENKTFHCGSSLKKQSMQKRSSHTSKVLVSLDQNGNNQNKQNKVNFFTQQLKKQYSPFQDHYACNQQRSQALNMIQWIEKKLHGLLADPNNITLKSISDYNQTVINYGLGQVIQSVRKRCKEEAQLLNYVWDHTFALFQNIFAVLVNQISTKEKEYLRSQKQLSQIFQQNLAYLKSNNRQLEKQNELLYEKMKKIVLWNRQLRKDRYKQDINIRILNYRLETYHSALQEATSMLLSYSSEPECAILAKKIIKKLYRDKIRHRKKKLLKQAEQHVNQSSKQFVRKWLKNYQFSDDKVEEATILTNQQKLDLMIRSDEDKKNEVDIYDFFQTYSRGVQTHLLTEDKSMQYEFNQNKKCVNIGVGSKKIYTMNKGIQSVLTDKNQKQQRLKKNSRKNIIKTNKTQILTKKPIKNNRNSSKKQTIQENPVINKRNLEASNVHQQSVEQEEEDTQRSKQQFSQGYQDANQYFSRQTELSIVETGKDSIKRNTQKILMEMNDWNTPNKYNNSQEFNYNFSSNNIDDIGETSKAYISSHLILNNQMGNLVKNSMTMMQRKIMRAQSTAPGLDDQILSQKRLDCTGYQSKNLLKNKFQQTYQLQMRQEVLNNKQEMIRGVVRKRSFYKNSQGRNQQKQYSLLQMYKLNQRRHGGVKRTTMFNQIDDEILQHFSSLMKGTQAASNIIKLRNYQLSLNTMSSLVNSINNDKNVKPVPRNKQFISLSVTNITKSISQLLYDYLRKIKADRENIFIDIQKVYYPLSNILVEKMTNKYGLRDIAEKKIRDFLQKISSFARLNQRVGLFYRLLGAYNDPNEKIGGDQLLIYMKSIVYLDINRTVSILNVNKDFSIDRAATTRQVVIQQLPELIKEFFPSHFVPQIMQKINKYFETYQLPQQFQIQKISQILIDEFVRQKIKVFDDYVKIHKNLQGNFYLNLYKFIEMASSQFRDSDKKSSLKLFFIQSFKSSDILDQVYGKSISEQKFVGLCIKYSLPKFSDFSEIVHKINTQFFDCIKLKLENRKEDIDLLWKISHKNKIHIALPQINPTVQSKQKQTLQWSSARVAFEVSQLNANILLGNLGYIKKAYVSLSNKGQNSSY